MTPVNPASGRFASNDPGQVESYLSRRIVPHHMRLLDGSKIAANFHSVDLGAATVVDVRFGANVELQVGDVEDCYIINATLHGGGTITTRTDTFSLLPGTMLISPPGAAATIRISETNRHITVRIHRRAVEEYAAELLNAKVKGTILFDTTVGSAHPMVRAWRDLTLHITHQHANFPQLFDGGGQGKLYTSMLIDMLLNQHRHTHSEALSRGSDSIVPWHVRRARQIIEQHVGDRLLVSTLARSVGVSMRCLQTSFLHFLGLSPGEYMRRYRLERLHHSLQNASDDSTVAQLMTEHGIANFGRFAQYYRERYGVPPSESLRRRRLS